MNEQEYIQLLAKEAHDTIDMLSPHRRCEREIRTCAAFLRCLGVQFSLDELAAPESDPPDVIFRDARFEVMILLDPQRTMHSDWKDTANQRDGAKNLSDLEKPYSPSAPISMQNISDCITVALAQKASHYGSRTCSELDALVYVNLQRYHIYPVSLVAIPAELRVHGWRSVCFVSPPYSYVFFGLPEFLRVVAGQIRQEYKCLGGLFDLE